VLNQIVCHVRDLFAVMNYVRTDPDAKQDWERLRARAN
jgi:hypothetical protein